MFNNIKKEKIMKAIYQKPVTRVGAETAEALMISASGDGETILPGGGSSSGNVTTSDSRRGKLWEDDDEDW